MAPAGALFPRSPAAVLPIKASLNTPDQITVGLTQKFGPAFTVHLGFEWTNWSRLKAPAIVSASVPIADLALNYNDGYFYSLGLDYQLNDRLTRIEKRLRAQYTALHRQMGQLSGLSGYIAQQVTAWNSSNTT